MRALSIILLTLLATPALAEPQLVARLDIDASQRDLAANTAAPLENGVAGNLLGGLGSGMAWAGGDTFLMLPDRGPNAAPYNGYVDNTTSYVPRFQTFNFHLTPQTNGLPYRVEAHLDATTLLWSPTKLAYGSGLAAHIGNGAPAINTPERFYFSGRSDNMDRSQPSDFDGDARLDPESLRVANDGKSIFISDEYGPHIYQFDRESGERLHSFKLPQGFAVSFSSPRGEEEISGNVSGREANHGMEGLSLTPDGKTLVGIMQTALLQDGGGKEGGYLRMLAIDIASGATRQYAYPLDNWGSDNKPKYNAVSEILAVNDHQFLVDERDGKGRGAASSAANKLIYLADIAGAQDISALTGRKALRKAAIHKTLFIDLVAVLNAGGVPSEAIPAKIEGMSFGLDVTLDGKTLHTLWISSDNDFLSAADSLPNPNTVYVIAFSDADLPGYQPQNLTI
ncbi:MAG: esterase-like activity of phytase family protein [Asticcacaulis sp.]|uniref:esterase-like activity of phytase family protein n=1 Tax=Asticcacaulis sp. TaxID=1872648 RepID=UPI003F7C449A